MQTCLQIIQSVCKRIGINSPNAAITSTDNQIIQLVELCNEEGQELAERYPWQALQREHTFVTAATELQETLPANLNYIVNDTIWNRTLRRPVYGPRSQQDWQQQKAMQLNGPFNSFRIMTGQIYFYPVPAAGQNCYYEYITNSWVSTAGGINPYWTADSDTPLLDDNLITLGTIWRWKAAKGLDYAEDFRKYEAKIADKMGRDGGKDVLNMVGAKYDIVPGVFVPAGSFTK